MAVEQIEEALSRSVLLHQNLPLPTACRCPDPALAIQTGKPRKVFPGFSLVSSPLGRTKRPPVAFLRRSEGTRKTSVAFPVRVTSGRERSGIPPLFLGAEQRYVEGRKADIDLTGRAVARFHRGGRPRKGVHQPLKLLHGKDLLCFDSAEISYLLTTAAHCG